MSLQKKRKPEKEDSDNEKLLESDMLAKEMTTSSPKTNIEQLSSEDIISNSTAH